MENNINMANSCQCRSPYSQASMQMKYGNQRQNRNDEPVGMAYVPWQKNFKMYENLDEAFKTGTIFPELNKPFLGRRIKG